MTMSATLEKIISALQSTRVPANISWKLRRAGMEAMQQRLTIPDDVTCEPADANGVAVEWIRAAGVKDDRIVFYLHGGGWVVCDLDTHDAVARRLALASGAKVVSIDYRLAPENKFPLPLDDCVAATRWIAANGGAWGIDTDRLAIAGDSAGGNLALCTCIKLRDGGEDLLRAGVLIYGAFAAAHRNFVLIVVATSKVIFIGLVIGFGWQFVGLQLGASLAVDAIFVTLYAAYLGNQLRRSNG